MPESKKFNVSCFNKVTGEVIYQDQEVEALDSTNARRMADITQGITPSNLSTTPGRRYVITPIEND